MRNYGNTRGSIAIALSYVVLCFIQLARWATKQTTKAIQATTRWHEVFGPKSIELLNKLGFTWNANGARYGNRQKHGARGQNKPQSSGSTGSTQRSQEDASSQPSSVSEGIVSLNSIFLVAMNSSGVVCPLLHLIALRLFVSINVMEEQLFS